MENIDLVRINFNEGQLLFLNLCLAFLMFGVALDIKLEDFRNIFKKPKAPIVGMISEYLLLPILTLILIAILKPMPSLAMGMILIAVCPGGSVSNFMVHLSKGNAALSVMLTSITTLAAIIITPLAFSFWSSLSPETASLRAEIIVEPQRMVSTIVQLVLIPVALGMAVNHYFAEFTRKIERPVRWLSILIFLGFVVFAVAGNYENIKAYLSIVFFLVLIHNGLSLAMGYGFARLNRLNERDSRAISIETGIQNTGLGLILVFNFFDGIGGMAMILAWWGVWHLISGFLLSLIWRK
ncbi:MAG: bile acid:sodium symporter family protein [Saprospiraceae bacterium]|nr:bile acid:sodium symporter family protein [Saprospiraceae bacterium]